MATIPHALTAPAAARLALYDVPAPPLPADEPEPGRPEPWEVVAPLRPDTAHVRALRFLDGLGELLACLVLIVGGMAAIGAASLIA